MKNEATNIGARTFAEQLVHKGREILQALQESALHEQPQNNHEEGVYQ